MNKIILALLLVTHTAFADCNFATGITPSKDGQTYSYTKECHLAVGQMKAQLDQQTQATADLTKAITLKDLAIQDSDKRTQLWMNTTLDLETKVDKIDDLRKRNDWLFFGLGALTVLGAGFMAASLDRHR